MTRMLDFDRLRNAGVPCFGTLERACIFSPSHRALGRHIPHETSKGDQNDL